MLLCRLPDAGVAARSVTVPSSIDIDGDDLVVCACPVQVRTWCGDVVDLPAAQGPADAVFFDVCFAFMHDQHAALWAACRLLRPGGHIVISRPMRG